MNPADLGSDIDLLERGSTLLGQRPGQVIVADDGCRSTEFEAFLAEHQATLIRPAIAGEARRPGACFLEAVRQIIESVNDTSNGQRDLDRDGGRTWPTRRGRVLQHLLALAAAIWHNGNIGAHPVRSLLAYDH